MTVRQGDAGAGLDEMRLEKRRCQGVRANMPRLRVGDTWRFLDICCTSNCLRRLSCMLTWTSDALFSVDSIEYACGGGCAAVDVDVDDEGGGCGWRRLDSEGTGWPMA